MKSDRHTENDRIPLVPFSLPADKNSKVSHPDARPLETSGESTPEASLDGTIICATDFSEPSAQAVEVAALLARQVDEPLTLVHAVDDQSRETLPGEVRDSLALYARAQHHSLCERVRALNVQLREAFRHGHPDHVLLDEAASQNARLLVMASARKTRVSRWTHGSVAERVAEAAASPTLILRNAEPLLNWLRGKSRLRVLLGTDLSTSSEASLRWVDWLRRLGRCELFVAYFEPQSTSLSPMDYPDPLLEDLLTQTARRQQRFFRQRVRILLGRNVHISFERGWAFSDAHLIERAAEVRADLIVVGTHSRRGLHRIGHHSVSRGIIHYAPQNVVCVPGTGVGQQSEKARRCPV